VVQLARLHREEFAEYLRSAPADGRSTVALSASDFLAEALAPFEAAQRAGRETIAHFVKRSEGLEQRVQVLDRQMAESERSEQARSRFEAMLNICKDAIVLVDARYRCAAVNDTYCRAIKRTREDVTGRSVSELAGRQAFEKSVKPNLERCFTGEEILERAWVSLGASERRFHEVCYSPLRESGVVTHAMVMTRDVTERQRFEEALVQSEEHYKELFNEACVMQESLRQISDRILHAHEEERKRISRELHDEVGQALTAVSVNLAVLKIHPGAGDAGLQARIADSLRTLEESMNRVHLLMRELRPPMLDELGLLPALHSYLQAFAERTGLRTRLTTFPGVESIDPGHKLALYRLAQEGLTNAAKHARATLVQLSLRKSDGKLVMEVKDDGQGFDPERVPSGAGRNRLGLLGMRERARLIGADFEIESAPGRGACVRVALPFPTATKKGKRRAGSYAGSRAPDQVATGEGNGSVLP
jgi:PAS domain S-box-containing protein